MGSGIQFNATLLEAKDIRFVRGSVAQGLRSWRSPHGGVLHFGGEKQKFEVLTVQTSSIASLMQPSLNL